MRIGPLPTPLLLLLLSTTSTAVALQEGGIPADYAAEAIPTDAVPKPRGLVDVPFDGKDGRPHAGPFVETNAERVRKKAMDASEIDNVLTDDELLEHIGPDGKVIPTSNDGVMDDRNRPGPKEGTRGVEGGISEKTRGGQLGDERIPDPPKEVPPLPHSEQQKIPGSGGMEDEGYSAKDIVLEVRVFIYSCYELFC